MSKSPQEIYGGKSARVVGATVVIDGVLLASCIRPETAQYVCNSMNQLVALKDANKRLKMINENEDRSHTLTMEQRDHAEAAADAMAALIGALLEVEVGEHSSANCPWANAIDALENTHLKDEIGSLKVRVSEHEEVLADMCRLTRELDALLNGEGAAKQSSLCDLVAQLGKYSGAPLLARVAEQSAYILRLRKAIIDATNNGASLDSGKWVYSIDDSVLQWPDALKEPANARPASEKTKELCEATP